MSRATAGSANRKPYVRPMSAWWKRDPFFVRYMWRELTAVGVLLYAVVLMWGVWRLSQGQAAFDGWLAALRLSAGAAPAAVRGHGYDAYTWFEVLKRLTPVDLLRRQAGGGRHHRARRRGGGHRDQPGAAGHRLGDQAMKTWKRSNAPIFWALFGWRRHAVLAVGVPRWC